MIVLFHVRGHDQRCCSTTCIDYWFDYFLHAHKTKAHKRSAIYKEGLTKFEISSIWFKYYVHKRKENDHIKLSIQVKGLRIRLR